MADEGPLLSLETPDLSLDDFLMGPSPLRESLSVTPVTPPGSVVTPPPGFKARPTPTTPIKQYIVPAPEVQDLTRGTPPIQNLEVLDPATPPPPGAIPIVLWLSAPKPGSQVSRNIY